MSEQRSLRMRRRARAILAVTTTLALVAPALVTSAGQAQAAPTARPGDTQKFSASVFGATHNSYSGNIDGSRGSITTQLDRGVRFVEFDIHDNGYSSSHDYQVGHDGPGDAVDHGGSNPNGNGLRSWLGDVASWSRSHPTHAPIVLMLDLKDNLTDNYSYAAGNPAALNAEIRASLGGQIYLPTAGNPSSRSIASLRGKIVPLLSGDATTRAGYKRDLGYHPAVAINGHGQIVEVHDSGSGYLWYWTGRYGSNGVVTWQRHGRFDTGITPAVALNDNGTLVEVHQSQNHQTLWSHVGHLGGSGEISWSASQQYDKGTLPTVRFASATSNTLREIHRSQNHPQNWTWTGAVHSHSISWTGNRTTSASRYVKSRSVRGSRSISVSTAAYGVTSAHTLRYATRTVNGGLIRYPQVAFDEYQNRDSAELKQGAIFYATDASDSGNNGFITAARKAGKLVRGWDFSVSGASKPLANYPASNNPYASDYQSLLRSSHAVS